MRKILILYYTKTGNSRFLAKKLSGKLSCDSYQISPAINNLIILYLLSIMRIGINTNILKRELDKYTDIIIVGPVWGGLLISPLRNTLKKCRKSAINIHFALTCETGDDKKDEKYGYAHILKEAQALGNGLVKTTAAFPTTLVSAGNKSWSPKLSEKINFTDENFNEAIRNRLSDFAEKVRMTFPSEPIT